MEYRTLPVSCRCLLQSKENEEKNEPKQKWKAKTEQKKIKKKSEEKQKKGKLPPIPSTPTPFRISQLVHNSWTSELSFTTDRPNHTCTQDLSTLTPVTPRVDAMENQIMRWQYRLPDLIWLLTTAMMMQLSLLLKCTSWLPHITFDQYKFPTWTFSKWMI